MAIQTCIKIEWNDIFLSKSRNARTDDIPIVILVESDNNDSIDNATMRFFLSLYGDTIEKPLTVISSTSTSMRLTTKIDVETDLFQIPITEDAEVRYTLEATFPDTMDTRRIAQSLFYVLAEDSRTLV